MITLHTVYVVTLVSQATSAAILWLLAAGDRRSRGLIPLATASTLHTAAIYLMPLWRGSDRWVPKAISAAMLPVMFYLIHRGLSHLTGRQKRPSLPALTAVVAFAALSATLAPWSRLWSGQVAWVTAMGIMACTARMLWRPRNAALNVPARITAVFLCAILLTFAMRLPLEPHSASSPLMIVLRELTIIEITLLAFSFLSFYVAENKLRHYEETRRDALTGLLNRRAMEEIAAIKIRAGRRAGHPLALLMMDLDAFKLLNDTWGHAVGDRALRTVGQNLLSSAPHPGTIVARLGGEEFAVLLPACSLGQAQTVAERLRSAIANISLPEGSGSITFTVSIGVGAWHPGETSWTDMLHRADVALYRAKRAGRNRVVLCDDGEQTTGALESYSLEHTSMQARAALLLPNAPASQSHTSVEENSSV